MGTTPTLKARKTPLQTVRKGVFLLRFVNLAFENDVEVVAFSLNEEEERILVVLRD